MFCVFFLDRSFEPCEGVLDTIYAERVQLRVCSAEEERVLSAIRKHGVGSLLSEKPSLTFKTLRYLGEACVRIDRLSRSFRTTVFFGDNKHLASELIRQCILSLINCAGGLEGRTTLCHWGHFTIVCHLRSYSDCIANDFILRTRLLCSGLASSVSIFSYVDGIPPNFPPHYRIDVFVRVNHHRRSMLLRYCQLQKVLVPLNLFSQLLDNVFQLFYEMITTLELGLHFVSLFLKRCDMLLGCRDGYNQIVTRVLFHSEVFAELLELNTELWFFLVHFSF